MLWYGGFWRRFFAYFIDSIILNIAGLIVGALGGGVLGILMVGAGNGPDDIGSAASVLGGGISLIFGWLYFALLESSSWQGTVGKKALGLCVTDLDGGRISFGRATGRYFAKFISAIIFGIGFLMVAFTDRKQGLHDMIASTLVYKAKPEDVAATNAEVFS